MTRRLPSTIARTFVGAGAAALTATALSGCIYLSPAQTDVAYQPADGAIANVGDVSLDNVLVVATGKGARGEVHGMVTNHGDKPVTVKLKPAGGEQSSFQVPAQTAVRLDGQKSGDSTTTVPAVTIPRTQAAPGERTSIQFATGSAGSIEVAVPVLLDQPPYGTASPSAESSAAESEGGH